MTDDLEVWDPARPGIVMLYGSAWRPIGKDKYVEVLEYRKK
jgi:hypothetical protein